jgi:DNA-binding XRE family transcriptional regulator
MRECKLRLRLRCFGSEQPVRRQPRYLHEALQELRRRHVLPPNEVADRRLADFAQSGQLCLRRIRLLQPDRECFHARESIGLTYNSAIGSSYTPFPQNPGMAKPSTRSFLDRALEALQERHPRERATQVRLAKIAGVSQPAVHEWGLEGRAPAHAVVLKLAHELNVCVEWLYTERGPKRPPAQPDTEQFVQDWQKLDDEMKRQVARYAEFLKGSQNRQ